MRVSSGSNYVMMKTTVRGVVAGDEGTDGREVVAYRNADVDRGDGMAGVQVVTTVGGDVNRREWQGMEQWWQGMEQ
ncbi:hypothetical protein Pmani_029827 [Petrolisthes manimaculis]|uniref:Uncharacterized protein n=1 Tax=Petrolisthes manimaculis TaxID=1843537 RepID=A0AAE1NYN8_9EUCA|nr:hypothetical protein Pmani_029827 [Petrolisthes manimaculis]